MLPVGDPLKDSGSSEEGKRKKQVRRFSTMQGHTQEITMQRQTIMENKAQLWHWEKCCAHYVSTSNFQ